MLSKSKQLRIQNILKRIANGEFIDLNERIFISAQADKDQQISGWLKKARRLQQNINPIDGIDGLLTHLNIGSADKEDNYDKSRDDLGEWFLGAPSWLNRS